MFVGRVRAKKLRQNTVRPDREPKMELAVPAYCGKICMVFAKEQGTTKPQPKNINPTGISRETAVKGKITAARNMPVLTNAKAAMENRKILSSA